MPVLASWALLKMMKIDIDELNSIRRKISVKLPADAVNKEFLRVYENIGQRAKIRGFRPGKAPRSVLQSLYGEEVKGQVLSRLVERSLGQAIKEKGLRVVSRPELDAPDLEEGRPFAFSAVVEVKPEIEVKDYSGLELEKVKLSVGEAEVDSALGGLQEHYAQLEPVEERDIVERGDFVVLDFAGSVDGKPLPEAKAENYLLEIGGGRALPQFEQAIVGLKRGKEGTISIVYPQDYHNAELAGKEVLFSVSVKEIKKKVLPPLDDEFAKDHGECASLAELRQKIRERLEGEVREIQHRDLKEKLLARLIEAHSFDLPPSMVEQQLRYLLERAQSRLAAAERPSLEELRKELEPQAHRQVRASLLVERIGELEKVEVSDQELQGKIEEIARRAGERATTVREIYRRADAREDLRSQMAFDRTLDLLIERVKVKEIEPPVDAGEKKS